MSGYKSAIAYGEGVIVKVRGGGRSIQNGTEYLSAKDVLCNEKGCLALVNKTEIASFDTGHLSRYASGFVANELLSELSQKKLLGSIKVVYFAPIGGKGWAL